jgi:hypothetical protein
MAKGIPSSLLQSGVLFRQREARVDRPGTLDEELNRLVSCQIFGRRRTSGIGHRETRYHEVGLARYVQGLAAGRQKFQVRAGHEQDIGEVGTRLHQMLAVVQYQKSLATLQTISERLGRGEVRRLGRAQRRGNRPWHELGVGERGKLNPPYFTLEHFGAVLRRRQGQARLACSPWTAKRKKLPIGEQTPYLGDLPLAPDEARTLERQVAWRILPGTRGGGLYPGRTHYAQPTETPLREALLRGRS